MAKTSREHAREVRDSLEDVNGRLREAIGEVEDPHAEALFETTAEVLEGLSNAYTHFEARSEEAWT